MIRLLDLQAEGFKGGPGSYTFGPATVLYGPNGSGKSRALDAVAFLFGLDVCGSSVDGNGLRVLATPGVDMVVTGRVEVDGTVHTVRRSRRWHRGSFGKSTVEINGLEGDVEGLVGRLGACPGEAWIGMTEDRLTVALAAIGARADDSWRGALREAFSAYPGEVAPPNSSDASVVLSGAYDTAKGLRDQTRRALRGLEGSVDRSRSEVEQRTDPGAVSAAEAALTTAQQAQRQAIGEHAQAEGRLASLRQAISVHDRKIGQARHNEATVRAASGQGGSFDLDGARRDEAAGVAAVERAQAAVQAAQASEATAREAHGSRAQEAAQAAGRARSTAAEVERARTAAGTVDAPCRTCTAWIDAEAQYQDPLAPAHDLAAACPFVSDAAQAAAAVDGLAQAAAEAAEAAQAAAGARDASEAAWRSKGEALQAARTAYREADARLQGARRIIAQVTNTPGAAEVAAAAAQVSELADQLATMHREVGSTEAAEAAAAETVQAASAQVAEADATYRAAVEAHSRLERLTRDRQLREAGEAKATQAAALLAAVQAVQVQVRDAGAAAVVKHAQAFVPWPIEFRGRVGLVTDHGFACGFQPGGLSAAQAVGLALGLDRALDAIYDRRFRLVMLELDHVDNRGRDHLRGALAEALDAGGVSQVIVAQWQAPGFLPAGWQVVDVAETPEPRESEPTNLSSMREVSAEGSVEGSVEDPVEPYDGPCHRYVQRGDERQIVCRRITSEHGTYHDDAVDCPDCLAAMEAATEEVGTCSSCAGHTWSRSSSGKCSTCRGTGKQKRTVYPEPPDDVAVFVGAATGPAIKRILALLISRGEAGDLKRVPHKIPARQEAARTVLAGRTLEALTALAAEAAGA